MAERTWDHWLFEFERWFVDARYRIHARIPHDENEGMSYQFLENGKAWGIGVDPTCMSYEPAVLAAQFAADMAA